MMRYFWVPAFWVLFVASPAFAAVAVDGTAYGTAFSSGTVSTLSVTLSGTPDGTYATVCGVRVSGANTYSVDIGGTAMTALRYSTSASTTILYAAYNVATSSSVITLTLSAGESGLFMSCANFTGVSALPSNVNEAANSGGTAWNVPLTTVADNAYEVGFAARTPVGATLSAGSNAALLTGSGTSGVGMYRSTLAPITPIGTYNLGINASASTTGWMIVLELDPYVAPPAVGDTSDSHIDLHVVYLYMTAIGVSSFAYLLAQVVGAFAGRSRRRAYRE